MEKLDQLRQLAAYYRDVISALSTQSGKHLVDIRKVLGYGLIADLDIFVSGYEIFLENDTVKFTIDRMSPNAVANILKLADRSEEAGTEDQSEQEMPTPEELARKAASSRLIAIFRKQEQDPYNRETTVGFPIITGMYGKYRFCAPLFYYTVRISHDPLKSEITLIKDFEIPAFNFHLLSHLAGPDGDIDLVRQKVLPYLYREDFERKTIEEIVTIIGEEVEGFQGLIRNPNPAALLQDVLEVREGEEVRLFNACVIVNARRSNAFLVDDLSQLAKLKEVNGETVIETILADGPPENIEDLGDLDYSHQDRPLLFPFESNKSQRRAARKADRARFMVIQGPPGTGKSQTIANIVCDLVTQGKTVLISSHQNKALEVIGDKLPKIDYLAMSMLKGEKESVVRLINQIENFSNYIADVDLNISKQRLETNLLKIKEKEKTIQELQARFSELKILERDRYRQQDNSCSYRRYHEVREYDQLDSEDEVPLGQERVVADGLKEWFGLLQLSKNDLQDLDSIISAITSDDPHRPILIPEIFERLKEIIKIYEDTRALLELQESVNFTYELLGKEIDLEHALASVREVNMWLNKHGPQLATAIGELKTTKIISVSLSSTRQLARQLGKDVLKRLSNISESANALAQELGACLPPDESFPLSPSHYTLDLVRDAFGVLSIAASTWWRWHLTPTARNAKRVLSQEGFGTTTYKDRTNYLKQVGQWVSHWSVRRKIAGMITHFREICYPLPEQRHNSPVANLIKFANAIPHYTRLLEIQSAYPHAACSEELRNILNEKVNAISDTENCRDVQKTLEDAKCHLERLLRIQELKQIPSIAHIWNSLLPGYEEAIISLRSDENLNQTICRLKYLLERSQDFTKMIHLECTTLLPVRHTRAKVRKSALVGNEETSWLKRPDLAVEAHRLSRFIRKDLLENPDDIQEVSLKIRELRAEVRHIVQHVLEQSRKIALKKAELDNSTSFEIKRLREILKKKRKTASFIQLRDKIDYQRLLKVFPCWIMSIEDVARVFPLSAGLFDILIVDEASQCNQAAALHLTYRAKRIIIVGDRKQMKNPNVRFLSGDLVNLLMAKHRLDTHPKSVFFHGREPLLHLADGTRNAEEFLNEHFRCEPPIIGWSNERFYNENLKILTPIRPRRFRPCMEVRLVPGADDDPEDTKQNFIEAKAVIAEVKRLTDSGEAEGLTIGILSLFRQQATLLQGLLHEEFDDRPDILKKHEMIVSTADGFQGDERDIILYSFRYGPSSPPGTIQAMQRNDEDSRGRLNVAFTRARRKVICFISRPVEQFPKGLIQEFLRHATWEEKSPQDRLGRLDQKEKCQSDFEREIFDRLIQKGLEVYTQVPCSSFYIDFVVIDNREGRRMAVECDGDFHYEEDGDLRPEDYQRQDIIERNGWFVHRIPARRYYSNPNKALGRLFDDLAKQMPDIEIAQQKPSEKEKFKEATTTEETDSEEKPAIQTELPGIVQIRKSETVVKSGLQQRIIEFLMEGPQPIWKIAHKVKSSKEAVQMELMKLHEEGEVKEVYENGVRHWIAV